MRRTSKLLIKLVLCSVVVETISETSHLCWNNETIEVQVKSNKHHNRIYILDFEHEQNLGLF